MKKLFILALVAVGAISAQAKQPNIIVILADDMGFSDIGCYGGEIPTPNLDGLARSGLLLTNFLVSPACSPSPPTALSGARSLRRSRACSDAATTCA